MPATGARTIFGVRNFEFRYIFFFCGGVSRFCQLFYRSANLRRYIFLMCRFPQVFLGCQFINVDFRLFLLYRVQLHVSFD